MFMAVEKPYKDKQSGKEYYTIKLSFDNKKDAEFLSQIKEINKKMVVTEHTYQGEDQKSIEELKKGRSFVSAKSFFKPLVTNKEGDEMEECPMFFTGSVGTAQMYVDVYEGEKGNTINLVGIKIHNVESPENVTSGNREETLAKLRATMKMK